MEWLNRVHCGDCIGTLNGLPKGSIDLIITSPPYNLANSTGNYLKNTRGSRWIEPSIADGYDGSPDDRPHAEYVEWQRDCLSAMMRVLGDDGAIFYNHKWRVQGGLIQDRSDIVSGFPVRQIIIWKRAGGVNFNNSFFLPTYEVVYLIAKPDFKLRWNSVGKGDVWDIPQERNNPHPAPFPLALPRRIISSTDARIVCDPFMGSGTTAVAAIAESRDWVGAELSVEYCDMANKRIAATTRGLGELL